MNDISVQKRNLFFKSFFEDQNRWVVNYGGAGSSKSYSTAQKILVERIMAEPGHRYLVLRKVAATLRNSVFQLFRELISDYDLDASFKINKTDMTIEYLYNGSMILFSGLDNIEKLKSIQGISSTWAEEASELDLKDILEINRRIRGDTPGYKQNILTFNPISHLHWLKSHFFDKYRENVSIYKSTYLDNKFIDDEYAAELEDLKNYDLQQYNIYALGEWGVTASNIVYHNYKPEINTTLKTKDDFSVLHVGIDFNIGGCCCVVNGVFGDEAHIIDFFAVYDTDAIISKLIELRNIGKTIVLYPDASGDSKSTNASSSDIQLLREAGFRVVVPPSNGAVRDRVSSVNRRFALKKLFVSAGLDRVSYALQTQAYTKRGEPEKSDDHNGGSVDDILDALGYFIVRMFPIRKIGYTYAAEA